MKLQLPHFRLLAGLSLLVLMMVQSSCTIEKRHFNNGYSVQWKKNFRHLEDKESASASSAAADSDDRKSTKKEAVIRETKEAAAAETATFEVVPESSSTDVNPVSPSNDEATSRDNRPETNKAETYTSAKSETVVQKIKHKVSKSQMQRSERGNVGKGIFMLIYALLFLLLALVFATLGTAGSVFALIFYIAASILFLFGIILIIVGLIQGVS